MQEAIAYARQHGQAVLIVSQPYISDRHIAQQEALRALVDTWTKRDPCVQYANLGRAIDLKDRALAFDGMHLTEAGNEIVAARVEDPIQALRRQCG
jgi:lysophospholipase L1-like esterase